MRTKMRIRNWTGNKEKEQNAFEMKIRLRI